MRDMCRETRTGVSARERLDGIRVAVQGAQENAACATGGAACYRRRWPKYG